MNLTDLAENFSDEDKARDFLEKQRWPEGPTCPHCGLLGNAYKLKPTNAGKTHVRKGVGKCGERPKDRPQATSNKAAVVSLVERGGSVRSRHVEHVTAKNLKPIIKQVLAEDAHVMTDSGTALEGALMGRKHDQVNHTAE